MADYINFRDQASVPYQVKIAFEQAYKAAVGTTCTQPDIRIYKQAKGVVVYATCGKHPKAKVSVHVPPSQKVTEEVARHVATELAARVDHDDRQSFGMKTIIEDPNPPVSATFGHSYRNGSKPHKAYMLVRGDGMTKGLSPDECARYDGIKDKESLKEPEDESVSEARRSAKAKAAQAAADAEIEKVRLVKEAAAEEARKEKERKRLEKERKAEEKRLREEEEARLAAIAEQERMAHYETDDRFGLF